jgi:TRAP-type C4-dicarboxylate transport system substrate-binding protein
MKAMGANPVSISAGDLFTSLQLGTVDGQESGVSWSFGQGYAEIQKHLTLTEHAVSGTGLFVNAVYFAKLPPAIQDAITRATKESLEVANNYCRQLDEATAGKYRSAGLTVTKLPVAQARALVKPVWDKYAPKVGGLDVINALVADGQMKKAAN